MRPQKSLLTLIVVLFLAACTTPSAADLPIPTENFPKPVLNIQNSATPTVTKEVAVTAKTTTPSATSTPTSISKKENLAQNMSLVLIDETIQDGTNFQPAQSFKKTWTLKNNGSIEWEKGFVFSRISSASNPETLGSPDKLPLSKTVKPGETFQLAMDLIAPQQNGRYSVFYHLEDQNGAAIPGSQIWVSITVGKGASPASGASAENEKSTVNGVTATLSRLTSDNQSATVDFCMSVSFHKYTMDHAPSLLIDQKAAPFLSGGSKFTEGAGCNEMTYQASKAEIDKAAHITLLIDSSVRMSPPPGDPNTACQNSRTILIKTYPGLDFQCHFSMAGYFNQLKLADNMTYDQANTLITDTIEGAIYGPWIINIK